MTNEITIRRRPDGSIDTDHYLKFGRSERSLACRNGAASLLRGSRLRASTIAAVLMIAFPNGEQS